LPGPFREVDRHIEVGEGFTVVVRSAADILQDATEKVADAIDQLTRKVGEDPTCCRCVFLLIHPFDGLASGSLQRRSGDWPQTARPLELF
jgi:hypothetical protein